jgi:hypothetical protein
VKFRALVLLLVISCGAVISACAGGGTAQSTSGLSTSSVTQPSTTQPSTTQPPTTTPPSSATTQPTAPTTTEATKPDAATLAARRVVTHFFYWYDPVTKKHMNKNDPLSLHPPAGTTLNWHDPAWCKTEFSDMIDAGIDIAACEYWAGEDFSTGGIPKMVTALDALTTEGKTPPGLGMFFDTVPLWDRDLTAEKGKKFFYSHIKTFFSLVPQRHWGVIQGRPVIWLYDTGGDHISQYDASTFEYLRDHFKSDFGVDPYIVADRSWLVPGPLPVDDTYTWGVAYMGFQPRDSVAGVGPGYDDHLVPIRYPGTVVPREDGAFYARNLYYALASGKNVLWLETWNEHHEASGINDTAEYGRTYIEITRKYVDMFKQGEVPPKPPGGPLSLVGSVYVEATSDGPRGEGLTLLDVDGDGQWQTVQAGGRSGWKTTTKGAGRYLYFSVARDFAFFDVAVDLDVTIEYLDSLSDGEAAAPASAIAKLQMDYDSYEPGKPDSLADHYRPKMVASIGSTGQWKTATARLTGVRFADGENEMSDFRLWAGEDRDLIICRVRLTKVAGQ